MRRICYFAFVLLFLFCSGCSQSEQIQDHSQESETVTTTDSISDEASYDTSSSIAAEDSAEQSEILISESTASTSEESSFSNTVATPPTSEKIPETSSASTTTEKPSETTEKPTDKNNSKPADPPVKSEVHITSISVTLQNYISAGEAKPYIKGKPIYQLLYNGKRVQSGDTLIYSISVTPSSHTDSVTVEASDNVKCVLNGNQLTVTILKADAYGMASISILGTYDSKVSASTDVRYTVDAPGDPFNNCQQILADYIRTKVMQYTTVTNGYTLADPKLSITGYADAPAWDDMIDKSNGDWISQSLRLIDEYARRGFQKANFAITETSVGFCASK